MKYFLVALLIIVIAGYFFIKKSLDNFTFGDVKFVGGDFKSIFDGSGFTAINLASTIENKNSFSVPVSGLYIELYHQGTLIGKSTNVQPDFTIPSMGTITIQESMTFNVNSSLAIGLKILSRTPVVFDYTVRAKLFGFYPLTYSDNFTY